MPASPATPLPRSETHQHRLGLIVEMMRGDDDVGADRARVVGEQRVARLARALLQAVSSAFRRPRGASRAARRALRRARRPRRLPRPPSGRRPWSTVAAAIGAPARPRHRAASHSKAVESGPPDTASSKRLRRRAAARTARRGARGRQQWSFCISRSTVFFTADEAAG